MCIRDRKITEELKHNAESYKVHEGSLVEVQWAVHSYFFKILFVSYTKSCNFISFNFYFVLCIFYLIVIFAAVLVNCRFMHTKIMKNIETLKVNYTKNLDNSISRCLRCTYLNRTDRHVQNTDAYQTYHSVL